MVFSASFLSELGQYKSRALAPLFLQQEQLLHLSLSPATEVSLGILYFLICDKPAFLSTSSRGFIYLFCSISHL